MLGFFARLLGGGERRSHQVAHPKDPVLAEWWGSGSMSASGQSVTPRTAMEHPAVWACVRVLAETIGMTTLTLNERIDGGKGRRRATEHPLYSLVSDAPNAVQTSLEWREMMMGHIALRGSAYSEIVSDPNSGRITALMPLHPDRIRPRALPRGEVVFDHWPDGGAAPRVLFADQVLYLPGLSDNLFEPYTPIRMHRESVGSGLAAQRYGARFFDNAAVPKFGVRVPEVLGDEAVEELRASFERRHRGVDNAHRFAVFDGGMEPTDLGMTNEDAQYLDTRKFGNVEIAQIFRVPPHKIGILDQAKFRNLEDQSASFVNDTMMPHYTRWEQRLNLSLLSAQDRARFYFKFEVKSLMRGDFKTRTEGYRTLWNIGAITVNQILALEDMNPVAGGDVRYVPLNVAPHDKAMDVLLKDQQSQMRLLERALGEVSGGAAGHNQEDEA